MSAALRRLSSGAGCLLLSLPFLRGSARGMRNSDKLAAIAADAGVPLPHLATKATATAMFGGAVALGAGLAPTAGAIVLVASLSGVTMTVHPFWRDSDPSSRAVHREAFVTNAALIGGLLITASGTRRGHVSR
jgi:putative oxidoreductase